MLHLERYMFKDPKSTKIRFYVNRVIDELKKIQSLSESPEDNPVTVVNAIMILLNRTRIVLFNAKEDDLNHAFFHGLSPLEREVWDAFENMGHNLKNNPHMLNAENCILIIKFLMLSSTLIQYFRAITDKTHSQVAEQKLIELRGHCQQLAQNFAEPLNPNLGICLIQQIIAYLTGLSDLTGEENLAGLKKGLKDNPDKFYAVLNCIEIISNIVKNLPQKIDQDLNAIKGEIGLGDVRAMRNDIVHGSEPGLFFLTKSVRFFITEFKLGLDRVSIQLPGGIATAVEKYGSLQTNPLLSDLVAAEKRSLRFTLLNGKLQQDQNLLSRDLFTAKKELDAAQKDLELSRATLKKNAATIESLQNREEKLVTDKDKLSAQVSQLQDIRSQLEKTPDATRADKLSGINKQIRAENVSQQSTIKSLKAKLAELQDVLHSMQKTLTEKEQLLSKQRSDMASKDGRIKYLTQKLDGLEQKSKKEVAAEKDLSDGLLAKLQDTHIDADTLDQINAVLESYQKLTNKYKPLYAQYLSARAFIDTQHETIEGLQAKLIATTKSRDEALPMLQAMLEENEKLREKVSRLEGDQSAPSLSPSPLGS